MGYRQTDQTLHNAVSDLDLHCLLTECFIKTFIKISRMTHHPYIWKWAHPTDKGMQVHSALMG